MIYPTAIVKCKDSCNIHPTCTIGDYAVILPRNLVMEEGSQIGMGAIVSGGGGFYMMSHSVLGIGAIVITATDTPKAEYMCEAAPMEKRDIIRGYVTIGERAYVGSGAIILVSRKCPDIFIGSNSVIGAGTFINKSIPKNTIIYEKKHYIIKKRVLT